MNINLNIKMIALGALLTLIALPLTAHAQMSEQPWSFKRQNRASIAALMQSVEDQNRSSGSATISQPPSATTLVCGSDGKSAAKGSASCIILNNSTGSIMLDQDSTGDQTASSSSTTNVDETINNGNADEILEVLGTDEN